MLPASPAELDAAPVHVGGPSPLLLALSAQGIGGLAALGSLLFADLLGGWLPAPLLLHGLAAAVAGQRLGLAPWWFPINLAFVPGALWLQGAEIAEVWFLAGFLMLVLLFWNSFETRVPLYLSNRAACERLASLLPQERSFRFLDLGCGFGGVLARLGSRFPKAHFLGVELAPLPATIARLRAAILPGCTVCQGDFWELPLAEFDVVYAFLSPVPMPRLWTTALAQMTEGSLLVSNCFAVPGVAPTQVLPLPGMAHSALYVYRMPGPGAPSPCTA